MRSLANDDQDRRSFKSLDRKSATDFDKPAYPKTSKAPAFPYNPRASNTTNNDRPKFTGTGQSRPSPPTGGPRFPASVRQQGSPSNNFKSDRAPAAAPKTWSKSPPKSEEPVADLDDTLNELDDSEVFSRKSARAKHEMKKRRPEKTEVTHKKNKSDQKSSRKYDDDDFERKKEKKSDQPTDIYLPEAISVVNLGSMLGVSYDKLANAIKKMGFDYMAPDFVLNTETSSLIVMEFGFNPIVTASSPVEVNFKPRPAPEDWTVFPPRPPVVTIMGHVDHGKTTLLDSLRKTSVAASEAGGITQHIGAFSVLLPSKQRITFLDTPGHAAFTAMRARGAQVTDIVVLVVAADDGVMPQTIEAIKHAKEAGVQMVVAINKCDKPGAKPSKVKEDLLRYEVVLEEYGGDIPAVEVSGLTGKGLDTLEETIVMCAELEDIRGDTEGPVEASVIESKVAKGKGPVATLLISRGTLKPGDIIVAGTAWCKVRIMSDENGKPVKSAGPSTPVEVSGWKELPQAGDAALQAESEELAKTVIEARIENMKRAETLKAIEMLNETRIKERLARQNKEMEPTEKDGDDKKVLHLILKGDVNGSMEALCDSIAGLPNHEVVCNIVYSAVGAVTDSDIELAAATNAKILTFNINTDKKTLALAKTKKVDIHEHRIIYTLLDEVKEHMAELLPPDEIVEVQGEAEVLQIFQINVKGKQFDTIAGCRIQTGKLHKSMKFRVVRDNEIVFDGALKTFKHHKKDINEASKGLECGIALDGFSSIQQGDKIVCYTLSYRKRKIH
ncbi:hypothetical protein HDV05_001671 [Chytridiales sp. JEL 0842]|nr:hypothetical protein HDV05_001671 [Chytridiales sp. JEL 0842]